MEENKIHVDIGLKPRQFFLKRMLDIILSLLGLILGFLILVVLFFAASISTKSWGILAQKRIGFNGKTFKLFKFKTMRGVNIMANHITTSKDPRITKFGRFMRKTRLDELPQLWNILIGDMSLVGPRPDVPGYADQLKGDDRIILSVRPGLTGPASLAFKNEEELLAQKENPKKYNDEIIWPEKVKINKAYIKNYNLSTDIKIILQTIFG